MPTAPEPDVAPSSDTRTRLLRAAAHLFARKGIDGVKNHEIHTLAGQRNESALHYHFGNRSNLVAAILEEHDVTAFSVVERPTTEASDPEAVVTFLVRLLASGLDSPEGRDWLRIVSELMGRFRADRAAFGRNQQVGSVIEMLRGQLSSMPAEVVARRTVTVLGFMTSQLADRARQIEDGESNLDDEDFLEELVNLCLAMLTAPVPGVGRRRIPRLAWRQRPGQPAQG